MLRQDATRRGMLRHDVSCRFIPRVAAVRRRIPRDVWVTFYRLIMIAGREWLGFQQDATTCHGMPRQAARCSGMPRDVAGCRSITCCAMPCHAVSERRPFAEIHNIL
ncbi:jg425 [Pararge aegeria aegeria]|uniref:Jg425 protein n=1 Tax=Pararge aegeria aegeria TaxID=348720 RepID=A0A8S4QRX3_9NEOP|nr:jg425 [Pararge aegeria aegeria]